MKRIIISSIITIMVLLFTPNLHAQSKTIEERLADLEKRVLALEAKLGVSQNTPNTPKSQTPQLTDDIIYSAIKEKLKREVPPTWAGSLMGGKNAVIEKIDIQQIGNYNEQGKYWPVKCRVKGICDAELLIETKKVAFDKIGDFKLKQDDYGKWYAELETF
jgi:hypothetical protein